MDVNFQVKKKQCKIIRFYQCDLTKLMKKKSFMVLV